MIRIDRIDHSNIEIRIYSNRRHIRFEYIRIYSNRRHIRFEYIRIDRIIRFIRIYSISYSHIFDLFEYENHIRFE